MGPSKLSYKSVPEYEMSFPVWEYYNKKSNKNSAYFPIPEYISAWGIADLVLLNFKIKKLNLRIKENLTSSVISKLGALVMSNLKYNQKTSLNELSNSCAKDPKKLKSSILNFLLKKEYILEPKENFYIKNKKLAGVSREIIAIEFKKNDYKNAYYQAQRYKLFADKVYVAMPEESIKNALKYESLFKKNNVGLISVSTRSTKIIIASKKTKPLSASARFLCEEKGCYSLLNIKNKKLTLATYKIKPSLKMPHTRLSFELNKIFIL